MKNKGVLRKWSLLPVVVGVCLSLGAWAYNKVVVIPMTGDDGITCNPQDTAQKCDPTFDLSVQKNAFSCADIDNHIAYIDIEIPYDLVRGKLSFPVNASNQWTNYAPNTSITKFNFYADTDSSDTTISLFDHKPPANNIVRNTFSQNHASLPGGNMTCGQWAQYLSGVQLFWWPEGSGTVYDIEPQFYERSGNLYLQHITFKVSPIQ